MEIVSMLSDVTNVLNFEIKNLNIKILDLGEEKKKLETLHDETLVEAKRLELVYKNENKHMEDTLSAKQQQVQILSKAF